MARVAGREPQAPQLEPAKGGGGQLWVEGVGAPHPLLTPTL